MDSDSTDGAGDSPGGSKHVSPLDAFIARHHPSAIPNAGIRAGEIIGFRMWWVMSSPDGPRVSSLMSIKIWQPGFPMTGDINTVVDKLWWPVMGGVYAYRSKQDMEQDELQWWINLLDYYQDKPWCQDRPAGASKGIVWDEVKLWGEVIEHKTGYRAQFAKPHAFHDAWGEVDLDTLRTAYGLAA